MLLQFMVVSKVVTFITLNLIVRCSKSVAIYVKGQRRISNIIPCTLIPGVLIAISTPSIFVPCIGSTIYNFMSIIVIGVTQTKENFLVPRYRRPSSWYICSKIFILVSSLLLVTTSMHDHVLDSSSFLDFVCPPLRTCNLPS